MKKLILLFLLLIPLTYAAEWNYTLTADLEDELVTGEYNLGNLIIQPYIANKIQYPINSTADISLTYYDTIQNQLGYSITIGNDIIVNNEIYAFQGPNTYEVRRLNDSILLFNAVVSNIPEKTLNIELDNPYLDLENSLSTTINNNNEKIINVTLDYPLSQEPQEYFLDFDFNMNGDERTYSHNLNLLELHQFNITKYNCSTEMPILSSGTFCTLTINNTANALLDITASIPRYSKYFYLPEQLTVFPGRSKEVNLYYDLTTDPPKISNETFNITFMSGNFQVKIPATFKFTDRVYPQIHNFTMNNIEVLKEFSQELYITDNYNVTKVEALFYKNDDTGWALYEKIEPIKLRKDYYNLSFTPVTVGQYKLELRVRDLGENTNITSYEFIVEKMNSFDGDKSLKFGKVKLGKYIMKDFGFLNYPSAVEGRVKNLNYGLEEDTTCDWSIKILNNNNGIEQFVRGINETFELNDIGNYSIGFTGNCLTEGFDGTLEFAVPDFHEPINNVGFSGEIINYTIPQNINNQDWNGGSLNCEVDDTGDIMTSKYRCTIEYPLSATELNLVPVSQEAYGDTIGAKDSEINRWKEKNGNKILVIILLFFILAGITLYASFMLYIYPDLYWKTR